MEDTMSQNTNLFNEMSHDDLVKLFQKNTSNIRNVCVLAHVDHGKTSLVDSLLSYNNIINPRLAGDIRYMDSRPDEQERCITMKSSSISIAYHSEQLNDNFLINLIDSPGHVDFSSEIFSALKIVDGALILIDVIEGICSQTESVIKQAWDEKIKCVLVFNKIDRLITEIHLDSFSAYEHLNNLLQKANSLMGSLICRDIDMNDKTNLTKSHSKEISLGSSDTEIDIEQLIQEKENDFYFSPEKGNVIFASALDNWCFTLNSFSDILSKKFGYKREVLTKVLWGDFYLNPKTKKIYTSPPNEHSKPLFVEFVLDNIYKLYRYVFIEKSIEKIQKAAESIKAVITSKDLNTSSLEKNPNGIIRAIMRQWLPIAKTVIDVVIEHLPNPIIGCKNKIEVLFPQVKPALHSGLTEFPMIGKLKEAVTSGRICGDDIPTVGFISKMVPLQRKNIQGEEFTYDSADGEKAQDEVRFMAFARIYTGNITQSSEFFVIGPKHDPKNNKYDIKKFKFDDIYYFMGQFLIKILEVPPGNIFSIGGLENNVYKTATISSIFDCPAIIPSNLNKNSVIKVSITSNDIKDMPKLVEGLKKLNRCDPAVDYFVQANGEHILTTSGEVHLERCIKDLEDHLAKVKFKISPPIVNFKEGLGNRNYSYRKPKIKKDKNEIKEFECIKVKERKMDLDEFYSLEGGEGDIDIQNQKEILKSSMPMIITVKNEHDKKKPEKGTKHKVKDVINKNEKKTNHYIEKGMLNTANTTTGKKNNEKSGTIAQKAFAEDVTPNKFCKFGVSSLGMTHKMIELIEANEKLIQTAEVNDFLVDNETYDSLMKFKNDLLDLVESNKLKKLIQHNLISFGMNGCLVNMLIIKHISKAYSFFDRIRLEGDRVGDTEIITIDKPDCILPSVVINTETTDTKIESSEKAESIQGTVTSNSNISNVKSSEYSKSGNKQGSAPISQSEDNININININTNINTTNSKTKISIDEEISHNLRGSNTVREFLNAVKSGYELAIRNGPLCEENMYGVVFIVEYVTFKKKIEKVLAEKNPEEGDTLHSPSTEEIPKVDTVSSVPSPLEAVAITSRNAVEVEVEVEEMKSTSNNEETHSASKHSNHQKINSLKQEDSESISSKQLNLYGPFLGQVIGTFKDCCRKAYLNGEPRLYEAIYLCLFQIRQEHVGKIHFVINKRRGIIISESSSDECIKCTIEAVVPVAESFGFVEEIRNKSSGLANPMLQFYKWEIIDVDPFYVSITQEDIENYGTNIDTPNLARSYINKIRQRKGLPIDEKIIKSADKQNNLSRKR